MKGIEVCYIEGDRGPIVWGRVVKREGRGKDSRLRFDDGGWNYARDCFFTEAQCRRYNSIAEPLPKDLGKLADRLEAIVDSLRTLP